MGRICIKMPRPLPKNKIMVSICFYFQVHQPYRIKPYRVFDIGHSDDYFDEEKNKQIFEKVANKCYIPTTKLLIELLEENPEFRVSFSFSGVFLEQMEKYSPQTLEIFKKLIATGKAEILSETYYHSLAFLFSKEEFVRQVEMHKQKIKKLFNYTPKVFRNTELIYNNELANYIEKLGYSGIIAEGADHILGWRSPNYIYRPKNTEKIKLLMKNYKLSDDIAFRFSSKEWNEHPLTAEKFANWVNVINGSGTNINLFMDYETFGEHQWEETGIFNFMKALPKEILKNPDNNFKTPSELINSYQDFGEIDIHNFVSWADVERDLTAWLGNSMQNSAIKRIYELENKILETKNPKIIDKWRKLQTSDHFYYMCTKWFNDGDVHKYFNPYSTPYDAFIYYMNALEDLELRLKNEQLNN